MAAAFKDFIPMGNDNNSNSGDSWFVLSSASEEEDDESEEKIPKIIQPENCQKEITEKRDDEHEQNSKVMQLNSCHKEITEKVDEKCEDEKPKVVELENYQKESNDGKDDPINEKLKMPKLENCQETAGDKNDPTNEKLKMAKIKNCQETAGEKENELIDKKPKVELLENCQKEIAEKKENEPINKKPKVELLENCQKETVEKKEYEPINKKPKVEPLENCQKETVEKKECEILEKNLKLVQLEIHQEKITKEKTINEASVFPIEQQRKIVQENEKEKPDMTKHKRKSKGLSIDEGGHSEIALEVHALRETLIQLSLNLSNTEQEKYTAITTEVQALRETVNQLNNDLSSRISQIETRTEQVHTLLCRFIMTRYGNSKEPTAHAGTAVKEHRPNTSDVAVQAEMFDTKQALKIQSSTTLCTQNISLNENRGILPISDTSPQNSSKVNDIKPMGKEVKGSFVKTDFPSKVQSDSHGLKRPRSDGESNQASSYSNETFEESTSYSLPAPARRDETSKFSKERPLYNRHKPRHAKSPSENYHSFRDKFHQYPPTHQTQTYGSNRELAELAYRYSSENDRHWRKNTSNRPNWQSGNHRKHPYFKKQQEGDICSSDAEVGKPVNEIPDVLDDFMDKVIDEWAQDEDDCYSEIRL